MRTAGKGGSLLRTCSTELSNGSLVYSTQGSPVPGSDQRPGGIRGGGSRVEVGGKRDQGSGPRSMCTCLWAGLHERRPTAASARCPGPAGCERDVTAMFAPVSPGSRAVHRQSSTPRRPPAARMFPPQLGSRPPIWLAVQYPSRWSRGPYSKARTETRMRRLKVSSSLEPYRAPDIC